MLQGLSKVLTLMDKQYSIHNIFELDQTQNSKVNDLMKSIAIFIPSELLAHETTQFRKN